MTGPGGSAGGAVEVLPELPHLARELARSVASSIGPRADSLPDKVLRVEDVPAGGVRLAAYRRLCGFSAEGSVPATWVHVLAFPLHMRLMSGRDAPFPLAGLVHVTNRIVQERRVLPDTSLTITGRLDGVRKHRRGVLVDVACEASDGDEIVWRGESVYLVRGATLPGLPDEPSPERHGVAREPDVSVRPGQRWRLPADLGRRYAKVSGDVNPIHLTPLTARPFGFRRPIIHGMWTHARALAALEHRLPERYAVQVRWTSPIMLPATVNYGAAASDIGWNLGVFARSGEKAHLVGEIDTTDPAAR